MVDPRTPAVAHVMVRSDPPFPGMYRVAQGGPASRRLWLATAVAPVRAPASALSPLARAAQAVKVSR
jgi:hypothetical protein